MHPLETTTKIKYQAFVQEFERSRKNLFQNVKPQLGTIKNYAHVLREGGHVDSMPRKIYAPHLNDSVKPLMKETDYPPERQKSPTGFSPNQSHQSAFPISPMTLKDINRCMCSSNHHINCRFSEVEPPASKKRYQPVNGGKYQHSSHSGSYSQLWQEERQSQTGLTGHPNENYILSVVSQENIPKNSYLHRYQFKKHLSVNGAEAMQQWQRERKNPQNSRSTTPQSRKEWVGTHSFKNSKYFGRNDFYPQRHSPPRSQQTSYYEFEEADGSKRKTPSPGTGRSSKTESKDQSIRSPISNQKEAMGTPDRSRATSHKTSVSSAVSYANQQKNHHSYPQHSNQWNLSMRSGQLDDRIILGSILTIQRAWRSALRYRRVLREGEIFGGLYHTGSFNGKSNESPLKGTKPSKNSSRKSSAFSEQSDQRINEMQVLVEQLTFELRLANKNIAFLKHENDKLKDSLESIENNMQSKVDERIAVEKLNNSELVNQYVNVVETLLEEKKELSQKNEEFSSHMKEAEDIIKSQNEALLRNQREIEASIRIQEENNLIRSHLDNLQNEVKALKQELMKKPKDEEISFYKARSLEHEHQIQEMTKIMQEYEATIASLSKKKDSKKSISRENSPDSATGLVQGKGQAKGQSGNLSEENEKQKKESKSKAPADEHAKGTKSPSEKEKSPAKNKNSPPEKKASSKDHSHAEKKISSTVSTPEKKSNEPSRKSSITSIEGKGSPPGIKDKGTPPKKDGDSDKTSSKGTPPSNKTRKTLTEKPSSDELPLQTKPRSDSVNTKAITKQSPLGQGQKAGSTTKAGKDGIVKVKDGTKQKKSPEKISDSAKQQEKQQEEQAPELHEGNILPQMKKEEHSPGLEHIVEEGAVDKEKHLNDEMAELSFQQQTNPKDYMSFGSPDSKGNIESHKEALRKRVEEENADANIRDDEFDQMDEIHQDIMNRFGKFFSKVDENLLLEHLEETKSDK